LIVNAANPLPEPFNKELDISIVPRPPMIGKVPISMDLRSPEESGGNSASNILEGNSAFEDALDIGFLTSFLKNIII
jgi:hypothetical protein